MLTLPPPQLLRRVTLVLTLVLICGCDAGDGDAEPELRAVSAAAPTSGLLPDKYESSIYRLRQRDGVRNIEDLYYRVHDVEPRFSSLYISDGVLNVFHTGTLSDEERLSLLRNIAEFSGNELRDPSEATFIQVEHDFGTLVGVRERMCALASAARFHTIDIDDASGLVALGTDQVGSARAAIAADLPAELASAVTVRYMPLLNPAPQDERPVQE